jgi:hypothetical protein
MAVTYTEDGGVAESTTTSSLFVARNARANSSSNLPNSTSSDYDAMSAYWNTIQSILGGVEAMRAGGRLYLPEFPGEDTKDYKHRLDTSVFINIYADIVSNLAAKPFAEELGLAEDATQDWKDFADDVDGRGNNLHAFSQDVFYWGLNNAVDWIVVDYPKVNNQGRTLTRADEKNMGVRPYWVHVRAPRMFAVYSDCINGQEMFVHARVSEVTTQRDGFSEIIVERIRVWNREPIFDENYQVTGYQPATWQLWELLINDSGQSIRGSQWTMIDEGPVTIGIIPIIPFITGKRIGSSWQFMPFLRDCASAQVEHYQAESNLKAIKEAAAFPMLAGNGVAKPSAKGEKLRVGPRAVLYAPPYGDTSGHGQWTYVEPAATSMTFLANEIDRIERQMRELGRQPLTADSGNLTVVTTAFAAQKGNSAIQQWALNLKDALEQALYITALWKGEADGPDVNVFTDFALEVEDDAGPQIIMSMRKNGDLTRETMWKEFMRRSTLSPDFDMKAEQEGLDQEAEDAAQRELDQLDQTLTVQNNNAPDQSTTTSSKPARPGSQVRVKKPTS